MYAPHVFHNYTEFFEGLITLTKGEREITDFGFIYKGSNPGQQYELQRYMFSQGFEIMFLNYMTEKEFQLPFVLKCEGLEVTSYFRDKDWSVLDRLVYCPMFLCERKNKETCFSVKPGQYYGVNIYYDKTWLYDFIDLSSRIYGMSTCEPIDIQGEKKIRLIPLVTSLKEAELTDVAQRVFMQGKIIELFAFLLDLIMEIPEKRQTVLVHLSEEDKAALRQVRARIKASFSEPPSLSELSYDHCLNMRKLTQGFRQMYGTTIYSYVYACRMQRALFCLRNLKLSVTDTATQVGYLHQGHFISQFSKYYGFTPGQIKKASSVYK